MTDKFVVYYGDGLKPKGISLEAHIDHCADLAIDDMKSHGRFCKTDGGELFFISNGSRIVPLVKHDIRLDALLKETFGLNAASKKLYDPLVRAFQLEAFENGEPVVIHKFCHAERSTRTIYLSMLDGKHMLKLTGGESGLEIVPNGTDGIFMLDDPKWKPWHLQAEELYEPDPETGEPVLVAWAYDYEAIRNYLVKPVNFMDTDNLTAADQAWLYEQWLTTLPLDLEERPLLLLCGEPGGGKSGVLRLVHKALFGPSGDVSIIRKEDAFNAAVSYSPFVTLDNLDKVRASWLPVSLETAATGGKITLRELYTTNTVVEAQARAWLGITSTDSHYMDSRRALADRTIIFRIGRLESFTEKESLIDTVLAHRDAILTDLAIRLYRYAAMWRKYQQKSTTFRLASFAIALLRVARCNNEEAKAVQFLKKLQGEQDVLQEKNESLFTALDEYFALHPDRDTYSGTAGQIADMMYNLDGGFKISAKSMGMRLNSLKKLLERKYHMTKEGGEKTAAIYTFRRPAEDPAPAPTPEPAPEKVEEVLA